MYEGNGPMPVSALIAIMVPGVSVMLTVESTFHSLSRAMLKKAAPHEEALPLVEHYYSVSTGP
jgi:hypothetical protein